MLINTHKKYILSIVMRFEFSLYSKQILNGKTKVNAFPPN